MSTEATIYSGQTKLGAIKPLPNGQFWAVAVGGADLGLYTSRAAAAAAIVHAAGLRGAA